MAWSIWKDFHGNYGGVQARISSLAYSPFFLSMFTLLTQLHIERKNFYTCDCNCTFCIFFIFIWTEEGFIHYANITWSDILASHFLKKRVCFDTDTFGETRAEIPRGEIDHLPSPTENETDIVHFLVPWSWADHFRPTHNHHLTKIPRKRPSSALCDREY